MACGVARLALAALWLLQSSQGASAATVRENLLCEARLRLTSWYQDKSALDPPKQKDGVEIQISHEGLPCGGDNIPVTFGTFTVEGAEPEDVFNAIADVSDLPEWDYMVGTTSQLGEWREQQAMGNTISFVMHPFADREVFQWEVANATCRDDLWAVFSTEGNEALHAKKDRQGGATAAQDCLGAYWVQRAEDGKVRVTFTSQVNSHPFFLSASFVFDLMWGKNVDFSNGVRSRAQLLAKNRGITPPKINLPEWMYKDNAPGEGPTGSPDVVPPFSACSARAPSGGQDVATKFEVSSATFADPRSGWWSLAGLVIVPGFVAGLVVVGARVLRNRSRELAAAPSEELFEPGLEAQTLLDE